ncbi:alpha/beta hydrolase [Mariprofundus erugo]|uniref:alpha/beta fold hydrolase n=1 Tax=Mariprofundus erugo TaxID=2528639 RepID=UPI0010FD1113|nr:alpha/beta hydrolase [Mariprofundus erugo]TLS73533.1 alpha/beta hydrolase [Mariprofundus erugo]
MIKNEQYSYDRVSQQAKNHADTEAIQLLQAIGRPGNDGEYPGKIPDQYADTFDDPSEVTMFYVGHDGGEVYGSESSDEIDALILDSGLYDKNDWLKRWKFSQSLFNDPDVWRFDATDESQGFQSFRVPVYFFMGQYDYDTPVNLFETYYPLIHSRKQYIRFEHSAHFPFYEEPAKFRSELLRIKSDTQAGGSS